MSLDLSALTYIVLPGSNPSPSLREPYQAAYSLWRGVWLATLQELDGVEELASDDFTRQSQIGALFSGPTCVALSFFNEIDCSLGAALHDSYFKPWPQTAIARLRQNTDKVVIGSNITVAPEVRGKHDGIAMKDLLMELLVRNFLRGGLAVMTGTMRNDRGMNECAYRHGATPILKNHVHHGVSVDLVGFYRESMKSSPDPRIVEIANRIWSRSFGESRFKLLKAA